MKKIFSLNKKIMFAALAILSIVGYGVLVFAAAPNGGYAPGTTLDPDCAPGDTDCVVSIGGLNPNSILYTNANGNITTDSSFTRNATNHDTYIGRTYQNTLPGDLTLTLDPLIVEFSPDPTPAAFVPGEQLTFEDTNTNTTYTGVYSGFANTINQPEINANTTFNGSGINDLNASAYSDYSGPIPTTFTITIVEKDLPIYGLPNWYSGTFQIGETVIGSNSGATGVVVSTVHGLVLDSIVGSFQTSETITGNTSGATVNNDVNGNPTDVFSYDNGDISGIGIAGYGSVEVYNGSFYFNMNNSTGHEIGDQWTVDVTSTPFYIHIHKVSNINSSVQEEQLSITGQTSNVSIQAGLYAVTPLGAPGDQIIFQNFSGPTPIIDGIGAITAVNGNNYGIQIQQGTYHVGDLAFINNQNGDNPLALVSTANTDPITVDMSSGFSINSNILGAGLRGSVFQQTDGTITGVMGALDTSSVGGRSVTLGSNISSTATNATSFTSQTIDEIIQTVEMNSGDKSILSLTGSQFKLSTTYTSNPNPALESGFMSTFNQSTTLVPAWFVGSNVQKLPSDLGSSGYVLTTDGSGNLSWAASSGGSSPISINGSTLYSSGLANTGSYSNSNIFLGDSAGYNATGLGNSNFLGQSAGYNATNASYSNFLGLNAGNGATSASYSNFLGLNAGNGATGASNSNFLGQSAGYNATNASNSNFLGYSAGYGATGASNSNFFGISAGYYATGASNSNFLGQSAGFYATSANNSNFLGYYAGNGATNAYQSNFLGYYAGINATNASNSNFFGQNAGYYATSASNSIFIGKSAGNNDLVNNTGSLNDFSILIGPNTSTGNNGSGVGYSNSIALGGYATNTASNQFMIGSTTRPINQIVMVASGGTTCATDINGTACSSDERLKTNITDLTADTLEKVLNIKTVTFNWNNNTDTANRIGFIAQDIQQYFPELVSTGSTGYLSVNYAGMTPVLVQAIREMNLKITTINNTETPNTWRDSLIAWFGNVENGITDFFAKRVTTDELCVGTVCVTQDQFLQMVQQSGQIPVVQTPSPNPQPADTPTEDTSSDQSVTDTVSPSDTPASTENTDIGTSDTPSSDSSSDTSSDSGIDTETAL